MSKTNKKEEEHNNYNNKINTYLTFGGMIGAVLGLIISLVTDNLIYMPACLVGCTLISMLIATITSGEKIKFTK